MSPRRARVLVACAALFLAVLFCRDVVTSGDAWGRVFSDWDQHLLYHAAPRRTLLEYGQFPAWNPWLCFGHPMLGNPQSRFLTPWFLLHLLLGTLVALKIEIVGHVFVAILGGYRLARRVAAASRPAALLAGGVYGTCGAWALHLNEGHTWYLAFAYLPWTLWAFLASPGTTRLPGLVPGALLALMVFEGGTYPAPYTALALCVVAVALATSERSARPLRLLAGVFAWGVGLAAVKLFAVADLMHRVPRLTPTLDRIPVEALYRIFLEPDQSVASPYAFAYPTRVLGWQEFGHYVGLAPFLLAALGAATAWRCRRPLAALALVALALAFGDVGPWAPWRLLHLVPPFSSLRVPTRFLNLFVLCLAVFAAVGTHRLARALARRAGGRAGRLAEVGVVAALLLSQAWVAGGGFRGAFVRSPPAVGPSGPFTPTFGNRTAMYPAFLANRATCVDCYELSSLMPGPNDAPPGYVGPTRLDAWHVIAPFGGSVAPPVVFRARVRPPTPVSVRLVRFSPNAWDIDVETSVPGQLVVAQADDGHWRAEGLRVETQTGLVAVPLPGGHTRVALRYRPVPLWAGAALSALTLLVALLGLRRARRA